MLNRTPCTDVNPRSGQDRLCRVTCQLAPGIDPAQWHLLCRSIGQLDAAQFRAVAIAVTTETHRRPVARHAVHARPFQAYRTMGH